VDPGNEQTTSRRRTQETNRPHPGGGLRKRTDYILADSGIDFSLVEGFLPTVFCQKKHQKCHIHKINWK